MYVCVCVRENENENEKKKERERDKYISKGYSFLGYIRGRG